MEVAAPPPRRAVMMDGRFLCAGRGRLFLARRWRRRATLSSTSIGGVVRSVCYARVPRCAFEAFRAVGRRFFFTLRTYRERGGEAW